MTRKLLVNSVVVAAVAGSIGVVLALKNRAPTEEPVAPAATSAVAPEPLPTLVDLGAGKCIPCRKMAPLLDELKEEYAGRLSVVFHDVWKDPEPGKRYGIHLIPTQIFLDAEGTELFRHEGFFSKEDILAKWKELGVDLNGQSEP